MSDKNVKMNDIKRPTKPAKAVDAEKIEINEPVKVAEVENQEKKNDTPEKEQPEKKRINFLKFLIPIFALLLIGGAFAAWQAFSAGKKINKQKTIEAPKEEAKPVQALNKEVYVTAAEGLRLRKEPTASAEVMTTMSYASKLKVSEEHEGWYKVSYNELTGWCMQDFTSETKPKELSIRDIDFSNIINLESSGRTNVSSLLAPIYGDFNHDGKEEALLTVQYDGTGGYKDFYVYGYKDGYLLTKYLELTGKSFPTAYVNGYMGHEKLEFVATQLVLSYPLYKAEDPNCCPTGGTEYVFFKWDGSKFIIDRKETKK